MANPVKPRRQNVGQERANELPRFETHDLLAIAISDPVVLPSERNRLGIGADEARIRDRHPVRVPAEIGENRVGSSEGRFGVYHPCGLSERCEEPPVV